MDIEGIMLSETSQTKTDTVWSYLYVESETKIQTKMNLRTKNRLVVARSMEWRMEGVGKMDEGDHKIQTSS